MNGIIIKLILVLFLSNYCLSQTDTIRKTTFLDISPKLYGCQCFEEYDTINYGIDRPLVNDEIMLETFNSYLTHRYQINTEKYLFYVPLVTSSEPKGKFMKDIWVEIAINENGKFEDVSLTLPLCAFEYLFRTEGPQSVNDELFNIIEFAKHTY